MAETFDLVLLIDEANAEVRGAGVNQHFDWACLFAERGMYDEASVAMRIGRDEVSGCMLENASNVGTPVVIFGEGARVLYQALAGRSYGSKPSEYSSGQLRSIAQWARAHILARCGDGEAWALAWRCIEAQGAEIRPWLCTVIVDDQGVPVVDSPLYDTRLLLSGGGLA